MPRILLLLPGLMCDEAVWAPQVQALSGVAQCVMPAYGLCDSLPAMVHPSQRSSPLFELVLDMLERSSPEQFAAKSTHCSPGPMPARCCPASRARP